MVYFRGFTTMGCEPDEMGIGPVYSVPKLLKNYNMSMNDIDLWELNEAFAVQVAYCRDKLGIPMDKLYRLGFTHFLCHHLTSDDHV